VAAQKSTDGRNAAVVAGGDQDSIASRSAGHRTELEDAENAAIEAGSFLAEEDRAGAGQFDGEGGAKENRGKQNESEAGPDNVEKPLDHDISVWWRSAPRVPSLPIGLDPSKMTTGP
jgi:hypothetical protein